MITIVQGHVLTALARIPDNTAHCVVTSPPYWGLRDYGLEPQVWGGDTDCDHEWAEALTKRNGRDWDPTIKASPVMRNDHGSAGQFCEKCAAWRGNYGLEPTISLYVENSVRIFREVRRVLRPDGVCFLNLGDSYVGSGGPGSQYDNKVNSKYKENFRKYNNPNRKVDGLQPKQLAGVPWRVALALQEDGWWLRSDIIWYKPNPMPESVKDRPTRNHEYIFLLTKSKKYFWDQEATREALSESTLNDKRLNSGRHEQGKVYSKYQVSGSEAPPDWYQGKFFGDPAVGRNIRSVWKIATQSTKEAHFATFPFKLVQRCLLAGTSEKGCCPKCGKQWVRIVDRKFVPQQDVSEQKGKRGAGNQKPMDQSSRWNGTPRGTVRTQAHVWTAGCKCGAGQDPIPCVVLDPFGGSMTTALVAGSMQRSAICTEINPEYVKLGVKRAKEKLGMFAEINLIEG